MLVLLCLMFVYALFSLGQVLVEAVARARLPQGQQPLHRYWQRNAHLGSDGLELYVLKQLELQRIVSRVAPLLGLVATMIPMGPALVAVAAGNTQGMAQNLVVAFAAVIVALLAAAITFVVQTLRKRWLMSKMYSSGMRVSTPRFICVLMSSSMGSPRNSCTVRSSICV